MTSEEIKNTLSPYGIILECESPLEISTEEGDRASGRFAEIVITKLADLVRQSDEIWNHLPDICKQEIAKKNLVKEQFTCHGCALAQKCEYTFNLYNIDGACLDEK
jgi:hypothetical protein